MAKIEQKYCTKCVALTEWAWFADTDGEEIAYELRCLSCEGSPQSIIKRGLPVGQRTL